MRRKVIYKEEKPIYGTDIGVSIKAHWKHLPPILHGLKKLDISIHKAKYWEEWTTMYLKTPKTAVAPLPLTEIFKDSMVTSDDLPMYSQKLPYSTCVYIYNISTAPYTILDFGCQDRTGLFCEILEVLSSYDIEVNGAYINTIGNVVSNIFYITHKDKKLDDDYMSYIRNNLEIEMRTQDLNSY